MPSPFNSRFVDGILVEKAVGICPACGEAVYPDQEPVWTCPADLSPSNAYWQEPGREISEQEQERTGIYSDCLEDYGEYCPHQRMPLHGDCYDGNYKY